MLRALCDLESQIFFSCIFITSLFCPQVDSAPRCFCAFYRPTTEWLSFQEKNLCPLITLEEKNRIICCYWRTRFFIVLLLLSLFPTLIQVQNTNLILKYLMSAVPWNPTHVHNLDKIIVTLRTQPSESVFIFSFSMQHWQDIILMPVESLVISHHSRFLLYSFFLNSALLICILMQKVLGYLHTS